MKGVLKVASGTEYTTSHNASVVVPNPMDGPESKSLGKTVGTTRSFDLTIDCAYQ